MSTEPQAAHEECGWKQGKIGGGENVQTFITRVTRKSRFECGLSRERHAGMEVLWSKDMRVKGAQVPAPSLRAGGREDCAKPKAFGTVLATAPSPAFYLAPKKPHAQVGGFFGALTKSGRGGVEGGVFFTPCLRPQFSLKTAACNTKGDTGIRSGRYVEGARHVGLDKD
jgi:hypothetical protein